MHRFFIKTPRLVQWLLPSYVWRIPTKEKDIYLTFDDGPHPTITPFVLEQMKNYNAKGTFFCVGNNVLRYSETYRRILDEGHSVGNHTQDHMNGWKVSTDQYIDNVSEAFTHIRSHLFRPPYGKMKMAQAKRIKQKYQGTRIILWDVLSADFDQKLTPEDCVQNVIQNVSSGSIIVFHDSEKAFSNLQFALPKVLEFLSKNGYRMKSIQMEMS